MLLLLAATFVLPLPCAQAVPTPDGIAVRSGDQSVVIHWERSADPAVAGYRVYRSVTGSAGPFTLLTQKALTTPGFCDLSSEVINGMTNFYRVTAMDRGSAESAPCGSVCATPHAFASDDEFLDYVQETSFDYFWYLANPTNGLIPDRTAEGSACSIAAVGFGLSAIGIGVDHGWIARSQAAARVRTTLTTLLHGAQGAGATGCIGYKGWFYHFIDMNTGARANCELSSMDTALLLSGVLYAKQYFSGADPIETEIRKLADAIYRRVDWTWMGQGSDALAMGWEPGSGFSRYGNWIGYNEGMILYLLGLGAPKPLPATAWKRWTGGYAWGSQFGQDFTLLPPLFVYQYSHCWVDFRNTVDAYMTAHGSTYFENSRRATRAHVAYAKANPGHRAGYGGDMWGLTACDGPHGYAVHGITPGDSDDGTLAPTAAGGSIPFAPECCVPALRAMYTRYRRELWSAYGFRDAFNPGVKWFASDELGIDQGPFVLMIENHRTQRVWNLFMKNPEVQLGLQRAGFNIQPSLALSLPQKP